MCEVIKGSVTVKVHGILKQKPLTGNWAVLYDGGPPYIKLFEKNASDNVTHTLLLEHLRFADKSYRQQEPFFVLSIKKEKYHFEFESAEDKEDWIQSLCHVSQDLWKQRGSTRESSEVDSDSVVDMSENVIYDSCDKVMQFKVSINPNRTSEALGLKGHYMLNPTKDTLRLLELGSAKSVHEWPYRQIRKYGCTRKIFKMEVGRRCSSGAGDFEFFTPEGSTVAEWIKVNTQMVFSQEHKQLQATTSAPLKTDVCSDRQKSAERLTSSQKSERSSDLIPQRPPALPTHNASENNQDFQTKDSREERGSTFSVDSKESAPALVPRSSVIRPMKENITANGGNESAFVFSNDTKIYETPFGLTAPLNSQLKQELHSKLHAQSAPETVTDKVEDDPVSDTTESSFSRHDSIESIKDKKKSEKERKKLEKEQKAAEAKRKKQEEKQQKERERELKEQREREAKEEKERQKRLKKESKLLDKQKRKKSVDTPAPMPATGKCTDANIYDDPGELLVENNQGASSQPPDPGYSEASDFVPGLSKASTSGSAEGEKALVYATPQKSKNSWKTHARPESDHVHDENYDAIKRASQPQNQRPPIPPQLHQAIEEEDTYDHLGRFKPPAEHAENVYGMASAKDTVQSARPVIAGGYDYEDCDSVCPSTGSRNVAREVLDGYEETNLAPRAAISIGLHSDGGYTEVSHT